MTAPERWAQAQEKEIAFWNNFDRVHNPEGKSTPHNDWWKQTLVKGFGIADEFRTFFKDKDIMEVGAGPYGMIYSITNARSRAAVEPMEMPNLDEWKKKIVKHGKGEELPFNSNSFDVVLNINVLDHCIDPAKVVSEMARVLRPDGRLLIWVHTMKPIFKLLTPLLNALDGPHPWHFTLAELKALLEPHFEIERVRVVNGLGFDGHLPAAGRIKIAAGNRVMQNTWIIATTK